MIVSYVRTSTIGQNTDRQHEGLAAIKKFDRVYEDKVSGSIEFKSRPSGKRLIDDIGQGIIKEVYVWETSRLGRSLTDVLSTIEFFTKNGVQLISVKEGLRMLNDDGTINPTAQLILSVMSAVAQLELSHIKERQAQGIQIAKAQGKYIGRKYGTNESAETFLNKKKSRSIVKMLNEKHRVRHISAILKVSPTTIYKVQKAMQLQQASI